MENVSFYNQNSGDDNALSQQNQDVVEFGSVMKTKGKYPFHCLTIVGCIEGHYILPSQNKTTKYEHLIPLLVDVEEDPEIKGLLIILNTVGGDVEAGLAISELIASMTKPTVSLVLGGGHSIGVPLSVSAKRSFMVPSATMTIHPVRMNGLFLGVPQSLDYLMKMQERIVKFIANNSKISPKKFNSLMMNNDELTTDLGTVLNGTEAVELGLIDNIGGLSDAVAALNKMITDSENSGRNMSNGGKERPIEN